MKLPKDNTTSVKINKEVKDRLKKRGITVQRLLDHVLSKTQVYKDVKKEWEDKNENDIINS